MKTIKVGSKFLVNRIGLGTNRIRDDEMSKIALKTAVSLGINFIDTAHAYTNNTSERIIGEMLSPYPKNLLIATKGGMSAPDFHIDSRPATLKRELEMSLKNLKVKRIDLYFLHRVDPKVPLKESVLFLKQMQDEGKIRFIGLSDVNISQIKEARKYIDVIAVENEYNLKERKHDEVIDYCEKERIAFVPFYPLRGISNNDLMKKLEKKYEATSVQVVLAWLLKRSHMILPIPGSLSLKHLKENFSSLEIELSNDDFKSLSEMQEMPYSLLID